MTDNRIIRFCKVLSVKDDNAGLRIKVRIHPEDADCKTDEELPYCFPLLPKHIHINPKVNECVMVILSAQDNPKSNRFFIGPLVSQQYGLNFEPCEYQATCLLEGQAKVKPYPDPSMNSDNNGTIPEREDIAIQGRQNTDIILKDEEIRLRCGFKKNPVATDPKKNLMFNKEDLAYIQMKFKKRKDQNNKEYRSSINMVADRINLLSHDSKDIFTLNDPEKLISDDEMSKILEEAHQLPYGDKLVEFLKKFIEIFTVHTHPFPMSPPSLTKPETDFFSQNLNDMLSQSIRIN